jgi:hypothetical protein
VVTVAFATVMTLGGEAVDAQRGPPHGGELR